VVLGAIWAKGHWGRYWGWDIKEVGGLAVLSWLLLGLATQWCKVGTHATMILSLGGNIVVALAWFGPNLLAHGVGSNGVVAYTLAAFVACNLVLLLIGLLPARALRLRRS
jgi:ABC-type transport system involved in cytochrome c biogenesis permease subunit